MRAARTSEAQRRGQLHPVLIMIAMILAAGFLTHVLPAGKFARHGKAVVPASYHAVPKINGWPAVVARSVPAANDTPARAAGVVALFACIPAGMTKAANLIFMMLFVGGMFGVLRASGAIDAGVDRLLHMTSGNIYLLSTGLMVLLAAGATFLGFISEYLVIIPVVSAMAQRLGLPRLFAPVVVLVGSLIGWIASVTNPLALSVAQPLAGVAIFSGFVPRMAIFIVMFAIGLGYVLLYLRRLPKIVHVPEASLLTARQGSVLVAVGVGGTALLTGTGIWSWESPELAAAFIAYGILLALVAGMRPGAAADAFLEGMQGMLLGSVMYGLASSMEILLQSSQVLDSVVESLANAITGHTPESVVQIMLAGQMLFGFLIHSALPKALISMPILTPVAHLCGVSGQQTVTALLVGTGLINMISPTNGLLLAFLAISKVGYMEWARFIAPLFAVLCLVGSVALYLITALGG